jgi:putative membrane protein
MTSRDKTTTFEVDSTATTAEHQRHSYEFSVDEQPEQLPEAIMDSHALPNQADYSGLRLEALPIKGLKGFLYGGAALVAVIAAWELAEIFKAASQLHWSLAAALAVLVGGVTVFASRSILSLVSNRKNIADVESLQTTAEMLSEGVETSSTRNFVSELQRFYHDKPQAALLEECLEKLPDYASDKEALVYIEQVFFRPLDQEAHKRVSKYCLQTGIAVAASPWASMDMLLALWRSLKMIEDVGQVYGVRPSKFNRLGLIKKVGVQIAFVGATELVIDRAIDEASINSLAAQTTGQIGQGLGAAIYCGRIGLAAMAVSRPVAWNKSQRPKVTSLVAPLLKQFAAVFNK